MVTRRRRKLKCKICLNDFQEKDIQESHNIPCYLFIYSGNRKGQKNAADKFGRQQLCKKCHDQFEKELNDLLKDFAAVFSEKYFYKEGEHGDTNTT